MLIKKPKSAPKQMLKSHSWANLSAPDRVDGGYHGDPRKHLKFRTKRKQSDLQLVGKDGSDQKQVGEENSESDEQFGFHNKENGVYHVRGSQTLPGPRHAQMAGNFRMRNNHRMRDARSQSLLCVNSTSEINNNKRSVLSNGHTIHQSHNDIYAEISMSSDSCDEQNTGGPIGNDELYKTDLTLPKNQGVSATRSNSDSVSRSHSLGDLSTGLTLSLVGQRKSDSMQSLPINGASCSKPLSGLRDRHFGKLNPSQLDNISENTLVGATLQSSQREENGSDRSIKTLSSQDKTPTRARRALPQVPGDFDEKKKLVTDQVKMRVSRHSSNSSHSPGSRHQQTPFYPSASSARVPSPTASECEISALLEQSVDKNKTWIQSGASTQQCNNKNNQKVPNKIPTGSSDYGIVTRMARYSQGQNLTNQNNLYGSQVPPGDSRISDSRQTTTTSQSSTVDSGYSTNEPEADVYSTTWYTRSLQRSAQNLYSTRNNMYSKAGSVNSERLNSRSNAYNPHKPQLKSNPPLNPVYSVVNKTYMDSEKDNSTQSRTGNTIKRNEKSFETKVLSPTNSQSNLQHLSANTIKPVACKAHTFQTVNDDKRSHGSLSPERARSVRVVVPPGSLPIHKNRDVPKLEPTFSEVEKNSGNPERNSIQSVADISNMSLSPISPSTDDGNSSYNTLPGNWKFHNGKNFSPMNEKKSPCLFQILQTFNLHPILVNMPEHLAVLEHLRLYEVPIVLPSVTRRKSESPVSSPQGRYAKLGGPGSAFKPVKTGQPNVSAVTMVTIAEVSHQLLESCEQGEIIKGDLIIEINEHLVLENNLAAIKNVLQACRGTVSLTVARNRCPPASNNQQKENSQNSSAHEVQDLEKQVARLILEIEQKDKVLQELNAMVPWKQLSDRTLPNYTDVNSNNFVPEAFLSGLSEDEFIV